MQTFLPHPDFNASAKCLDRQRLGKQRMEVVQLLEGKWPHHPASKMWRGYKAALAAYGRAICEEWILRGYWDTCLLRIKQYEAIIVMPSWIGNVMFHDSHKSNLLRKDSVYYGQFNWNVPTFLPYVWPSV